MLDNRNNYSIWQQIFKEETQDKQQRAELFSVFSALPWFNFMLEILDPIDAFDF